MEQKTLTAESWKRLNREVTGLLAQNGNRQRMILAILIFAVSLLPYLLLWQTFGILFLSLAWDTEPCTATLATVGFTVAVVLLTLFFTVPLFSGLLYLAERMEAEEETVLSDVFHAFTGGAAYRVALAAGFPFAVSVFALIFTPNLITALCADFAGKNPLLWMLVALAAIAADSVLFLLSLGAFRRPYTVLRKTENRKQKVRGVRRTGLLFWGRFLPHLLLSVLTLLIYFIADILPRMLVFYFCLCREQTNTRNHDDSTGGNIE